MAVLLAGCATPQPANPYTQALPTPRPIAQDSPVVSFIIGALIFALF